MQLLKLAFEKLWSAAYLSKIVKDIFFNQTVMCFKTTLHGVFTIQLFRLSDSFDDFFTFFLSNTRLLDYEIMKC